MRNAILLASFLLLLLGVIFARDRVKIAFQIGAALYAVSLVVRFLIFGFGDRDNLLDVLTIGAVFFVIWLIARAIVEEVLRRRERARRPPG
jgi:4-amino-4-deoxy-L-arabinose transferase-like glycosyltransferase